MELEVKLVGVQPDAIEADGTIKGYASVFGVKDSGGDIVMPGAFAVSLSDGRAIRMLWQHDPSRPIGVWKVVREDERGLYVEGQINLSLHQGRETYEMLKGGLIEGLSIGYRTKRAKRTAAGRELHEVELWEISLVTFPMLTDGRVSSVKAHEDGNFALLKRNVEKLVRDAGFTAVEAKAAAAGATDGLLGARDAAVKTSASDVADLIRQIATSE